MWILNVLKFISVQHKSKMKKIFTIILLICVATTVSIEAQRRITPVNTSATTTQARNENKKEEKNVRPASVIETKDSEGNIVLVDTISGQEYIDSTLIIEKKKILYPLFHQITVGLNVWDPIMRCLGQKYGGGEVWGELSLYNRFKPMIAFGLGTADYAPEDGNYTYKSGLAPYFKIGLNYNFMFKSQPDYQIYLGLHYGFTPFSYEINNISMPDSYWDEPETFNIPSQNASVGFIDVSLGIKVKIVQNFSLGWNIKYHSLLHESKNSYGEPWYIPGFGTRGSKITGSFSLMYTFTLNKGIVKEDIENEIVEE